ncbi:unnamed protein product [Effrenium voratum]|nr:unnamed protein product [Effrenium voratum]
MEQKCRAQEALLAEKEAQLHRLREATARSTAEPLVQLRLTTLEQQLRAHEVMLTDKDEQVQKLHEVVEHAKTSMQELAGEADSENQELHCELQALKAQLETASAAVKADELRGREEVEQLNQRLTESDTMCQALRWELDALARPGDSDSSTPPLMLEVAALRAEALQLRRLAEQQHQQAASASSRFRGELRTLRQSLRDEGILEDALEVEAEPEDPTKELQEALALSQGVSEELLSEAEALRRSLQEAEGALEEKRRSQQRSEDSFLECQEAAARLRGERDTARSELEELTTLASAFKGQAEGEICELRWLRLSVKLMRQEDADTLESLKESWSHGNRKWQASTRTLREKVNQRTAEVAKGDQAMHALEEKVASQGEQLQSFTAAALQELRQAQQTWEAQLQTERTLRQEVEAKLRDETAVPEALKPLEPVAPEATGDMPSSLEKERQEVRRLQSKLAEAEQTIGQLVVSNMPEPTKVSIK